MAKKDSKKNNGKKDKASAGAVEAVEAVRSAVERTFAATSEGAHSLRGPAQELAGDLAVAANRIREVLEDRVLGELKGLRSDVEGLARRVSALEVNPRASAPAATATSGASKSTGSRRSPASKPAASRSTTSRGSSASKPAASRSTTSR